MSRLYGPGPGEPPRLVPSKDLAGLSTNDADDRPVGELYGTLAEESTGLIRYLDVSVRQAERHVLVPIGHTRIDRDRVPPRVRLRAATFEDLLSIPAFHPPDTQLDRAYQDEVVRAHGRLFYGSRYYAHPSFDHRGLYAGDHPITGPDGAMDDRASPQTAEAEASGGTARTEARLRSLRELQDYQVARGEADVRGWSLIACDDERVGEIGELLVDVAARKVRYVVVELDEPQRKAALPVGYLTIEREAGLTRSPALSSGDIRILPAYEPPLTREAENRLHTTIEGRLSGERYFDRADFHRI